MNDIQHKAAIKEALSNFTEGTLAENARYLLNTLGYHSERTLALEPNTAEAFIDTYDLHRILNRGRALTTEWVSIDPLFQLRGEDLTDTDTTGWLFDSSQTQVDNTIIESYLFLALRLDGSSYNRTQLSQITREINKLFPMPAMLLFQHGETLTLSVINRRLHAYDESRDVLEKVTLIKDIDFKNPHRAHIDILFDLAREPLNRTHGVRNFVELHRAWEKTLDISELNKRFFNELADWYFWAVDQVRFPEDAGEDVEVRNATCIIRLLTRLIFVWFIKEKGLVPDALFNPEELGGILNSLNPQESTYYKAILQNLFFATLNQEINTPQNPNNRRTSLYHYKDCFIDDALRKFEEIPFLNGGLFECLDVPSKEDSTRILRVDGFSDEDDNPLSVPNELFFSNERIVDLNAAYGTRGRQRKVRGLIHILSSYKFTIAENTPIEEEVALDPELLGKVFENLLAAYNPETKVTARKETGSFYTPREIVNYMTDESLVAYLKNELITYSEAQRAFSVTTPPSQLDFTKQADPVQRELDVETVSLSDEQKAEIEKNLRKLFAYNDEPNPFDRADTEVLIKAIDTLKILDPAVGSGAFPMGVLHKLVFILGKLDPGNAQWKDRQIDRARMIADPIARNNAINDIEGAFARNELDYGRKLYLLQNSIFSVDIQPIACQIAKLRFFITLAIEQTPDPTKDNLGIKPLPNLETRIIAANTLIDLQESEAQQLLQEDAIQRLQKKLRAIRENHYLPSDQSQKRDLEAQDETLCKRLENELETQRSKWIEIQRREIDERAAELPNAAAQGRWREIEGRRFEERLQEYDREFENVRKIISWKPYDQNATADFFDPKWMFGVREGFDITIGNPPYVRADSGDEHLKMRKKIAASNQYETLWEKWDLYIPFIERSYKLLKPGGFTTLIVSDAYCHSKYAQKSQNWFLKNSRILRLDFLSKIKIFDAGVRNITYLFQRADGSHQKPEQRVHDPEFGTVTLLPTNEQRELTYRVFFPEDTNAQHFSGPTVKLEGICYITKGMVVHAHERKARGEFELRDLVSDVRDEHHPKPFVEGKHLAKWLPSTNKWLEWGTKRAPDLFSRPTFPELYKHDTKIMLLKVGEIRAALDTNRFYCNEGIFVCLPWHYLSGIINNSIKRSARYRNEKSSKSNLPQRENLEHSSRNFAIKYLLGILNSTPARDFLRANRRNNIQLYPDDWKKVPIPDVSLEQQAPIIKLVDQILDAKRTNLHAKVSELEDEIDQLVYELYDLTPNEVEIVDGNP